jgi:hypothetical protein
VTDLVDQLAQTHPERLILDMSGVIFFSAQGISALIHAQDVINAVGACTISSHLAPAYTDQDRVPVGAGRRGNRRGITVRELIVDVDQLPAHRTVVIRTIGPLTMGNRHHLSDAVVKSLTDCPATIIVDLTAAHLLDRLAAATF